MGRPSPHHKQPDRASRQYRVHRVWWDYWGSTTWYLSWNAENLAHQSPSQINSDQGRWEGDRSTSLAFMATENRWTARWSHIQHLLFTFPPCSNPSELQDGIQHLKNRQLLKVSTLATAWSTCWVWPPTQALSFKAYERHVDLLQRESRAEVRLINSSGPALLKTLDEASPPWEPPLAR